MDCQGGGEGVFGEWVVKAALIAGLLVWAVPTALAAPPEGADPTLAPWYQSLRDPQTGGGCCSIADCRPVEYRIDGDRYEVLWEEKWRPVPPEKVLQQTDNPTGRAVACVYQDKILCFVRPSET